MPESTYSTRPEKDASIVAIIEPGAMGTIKSCNGQWCEMTFNGHTGWLAQSLVWGAYPGERSRTDLFLPVRRS